MPDEIFNLLVVSFALNQFFQNIFKWYASV